MLLELRWTERPSRKREVAGSNPAESSTVTVPYPYARGAMVAHLAVNERVVGSNPAERAEPIDFAGVAQLVDARYSKYRELPLMRVRVPLPAPGNDRHAVLPYKPS
jgi:hypothetical protein